MQLQVEGSSRVLKHLHDLGVEIEDCSDELEDIGEYLLDFFANDMFDSEGGIVSLPWDGLSTPYKWRKQVKYPGAGTLVASGKMKDSFRAKSGKTKLVIRNDDDKFPYHQLGTSRIPARPMMIVDDPRKKKVIEILRKGKQKAIKKIFSK